MIDLNSLIYLTLDDRDYIVFVHLVCLLALSNRTDILFYERLDLSWVYITDDIECRAGSVLEELTVYLLDSCKICLLYNLLSNVLWNLCIVVKLHRRTCTTRRQCS